MNRLRPWLILTMTAALCATVFAAWLSPRNVMSWLLLSAFCN